MSTTKSIIASPVYTKIISKFYQNFSFCFAYGSAVKKQLNYASRNKENMIDFVFCVDDSNEWHKRNMTDNPSHYSALKYFGHNFVSKFQENFGAKVYFNTLVPMEDVVIKYGVISTKDLVTDLLEWSDVYFAGRLHKPVEIIVKPTHPELETALTLNLQSAVHAALLILPETFTEYEFYCTISNLSYAGDFRMTFGENKKKVENIVKPQLLGFRNLYKPFIESLQDYVEFPTIFEGPENDLKKIESPLKNSAITQAPIKSVESSYCSQDTSPLAKLHHLNQLPRWPQKALTRFWNRGKFRQDTEDVLRAIAYDPDCNLIVSQCISDIVYQSSVRQSSKNILTAGLVKSVQYSARKIKKMLK